jgi:hypothetical protein
MNGIYDAARYKLMTALFDWTKTDLLLTCWSGAPTFVPTDTTIADMLTHGVVDRGSSLPVTSKTVAPDGTAQTNQIVIPGVAIGDPITFFTMSEKKPTHNLSELILFLDEALDLQKRGWWKA